MFAFLKKFDAFPKANDDFRLKTTSGAIGIIDISFVFPFFHYEMMQYRANSIELRSFDYWEAITIIDYKSCPTSTEKMRKKNNVALCPSSVLIQYFLSTEPRNCDILYTFYQI